MKLRESGMPDESMWSGFFSPEQTLTKLGLTGLCRDVVDFGCGYGTFTIPAARIAQGTVQAFDIEAEMVTTTVRKVEEAGLINVRVTRRDFATTGTGLPDESADYRPTRSSSRVRGSSRWRGLRSQGADATVHSPVARHAENRGNQPTRSTRNADSEEPALLREVHDRDTGDQQRDAGTQVCQERPLVREEGPVNRELVPQQKRGLVKPGIRFIHRGCSPRRARCRISP